jgi:hypothetical protein
VRSLGVEVIGERINTGLQFFVRQVIDGVEFVSPGRLGAFDASVEVSPFGRQNQGFEAARLAFGFEDPFELGSVIDLNAAEPERRFAQALVERSLSTDCAGLGGNAAAGPFGYRVIGGEVHDRLVGPHVHEERVDLHGFARAKHGEPATTQPHRANHLYLRSALRQSFATQPRKMCPYLRTA